MARYKVMYVDYCHASGEAKAIEIADKELSNNRTMFSRCATAERVAEVEDLNSTEAKRSQEFDKWFDPRADSYQYGAEGPALDAWNEQQKKITALERRARIAERLNQKLYPTTGMLYYGKLAADAESEIDAELAKEGRKG